MDVAARVGLGQTIQHTTDHPTHVCYRYFPAAAKLGAQRFTFDEGHRVVGEIVLVSSAKQGDDVRVLQRSRELDLAEEPISIDPGGQLRRQDLEYHAAPQGRIRRGKDATHAAAYQFLFQT